MGILEQLLGAAMQGTSRGGSGGGLGDLLGGGRAGGAAAGGSPIMAILLQLLMGQTQGGGAQGGGLGGLLGGAGGRPERGGADPLSQILGAIVGGNQGGGGLGGLLQQFQQAGLGQEADSWVGRGRNMPVSPDQLERVFGRDRLQGLADQNGVGFNELLGGLSQHLPAAVDELTPKGALPEQDDLARSIEAMLGGRR